MKLITFNSSVVRKIILVMVAASLSCYASLGLTRTLIFQSGSESNKSLQASTDIQAGTNSVQHAESPAAASVVQAASSSANSELYFMIEQLQQEVNSLRGMLEEQSYELRMLKQSGKDRYLDLDTRILDLTKRVSVNVPPVTQNQATINSNSTKDSQTLPLTEVKKEVLIPEVIQQREPTTAENNAYQKAYAYIKEKKFDEAVISLFAYTENYPDSPLTPNVYYWLGEVYLATSKLDQAKTSFSLVVSAYPNSQKAADSLYKLAVTIDRLGDSVLARQYLDDVKKKFPNTTAAKLAASYQANE